MVLVHIFASLPLLAACYTCLHMLAKQDTQTAMLECKVKLLTHMHCKWQKMQRANQECYQPQGSGLVCTLELGQQDRHCVNRQVG